MTPLDEHTRPHYGTSALLTIDLQGDFLSGAPFGVPGTTEILPAVRELADAYRAAGRPIVHVIRLYLQDGSNADLARRGLLRSGAQVVIPGTPGARLAPGLLDDLELDDERLLAGELQAAGPHEAILYKPRWNAFHGTSLDRHLRALSVDTVVVAGCNYPNCPRGTLFGASERDYRAVIVNDAVSQWSDGAAREVANLGVATATTGEVVAAVRAG